MQSFDGVREIDLQSDGRVVISVNEPDKTTWFVWGTWFFDEGTHQYTIEFPNFQMKAANAFTTQIEQQKMQYMLIRSKNSDMCIFISGNANVADLHKSWFSRPRRIIPQRVQTMRGSMVGAGTSSPDW